MKILLLILAFIGSLVIYWIGYGYYKISISKQLIKKTTPFTITGNNKQKTLLVIGDSTAYGVGASTSTDSVPGRVAKYLGSTYVENYAVSGAVINDLASQIIKSKEDQYDMILVQIGANDITHFHDPAKVSEQMENYIPELKKKSKEILLISAGNVGGAPTVPPPLRPYYTHLNLKYHEKFETLAKKYDIIYVNLYTDPSVDPFILHPKQYFAEDGFHPSSKGYELWFTTIQKSLDKDK